MSTLDIIWAYREALTRGLFVTAQMAALICGIGIVAGTLLGCAAAKLQRTLGRALTVLGFIISSIPILVLLFWFHYPAQTLVGVVLPPFWTAVVALGLVNVLAVAAIVRPAIEQFPEQLAIAGRVLGLSGPSITLRIRLPLILRQAAPALLFTQVTAIQGTLFASLISVPELFRIAQQINALEYRPVQIYTALAAFFLIVCLPINGLALILHRRFKRALSER